MTGLVADFGSGIFRLEASGKPLVYYQQLLQTRQYPKLAEELRSFIAEKNATRDVYKLLALTYAAMGDWGSCQRVLAEERLQFGLYEAPEEPGTVASDTASGTASATAKIASATAKTASAPVEADPMVYVIVGKTRYHYNKECAGENAIRVKKSEVGFYRFPCQTCAKD